MRNHKLVPTTSGSSSKNNTKQEQPHLSGAYIRSLVKQLSSSSTTRSKDHHSTMGTKPHDQPQQEEQQATQTTAPPPPPPQQQQPHKKQVRRRLHTSRPYQERLLNMAEARREIVTALKIHRASMRQAKEQQQQQQLLQLHQQQEVQVVQEQSQATRACAPMSYASFSDYLYNSPFSHFTGTTNSYSSPLPYHTQVAPMVDASHHALDHLLPLPTQPLGLNLSFQGFNGVVSDDAKNSTSSFDPPLLQPSPTSSYSVYSSPSVTMASHDMSSAVTTENTSLAADASLHRVLDDEEMAVIYSIGEQHDIEWSDTVNLVTSAWWSKLLESVEGGGGGGAAVAQQAGGAVNEMEDALTHTPDWFGDSLGHQGTKGSSSDVLGMHLSECYGEDVSLPRAAAVIPPPCCPSVAAVLAQRRLAVLWSFTDGIHVLSRHRRRRGSTSSVSTSLLASDFASPSSRPRPTASTTRPPLHSARRRLRRIRCRAFFFQLGWQGSWCAWLRDSVGGSVLPVGLVNLAKEFLRTVESQLRSTNPSSTPCSSRLCRITGWSADGSLICPYCMEQVSMT